MGSKRLVVRRLDWRLMVGVWVLAGVASDGMARAAGPEMLDASAIVQMELKAGQAAPRDQCYRYAELLAALTELEGRQIAAGEDDEAQATMLRMDAVSTKIHAAAAENAKRLKDAEQMLERTTRRVSDMAHVASVRERADLQTTLQHMNLVHNELLTMVFAH